MTETEFHMWMYEKMVETYPDSIDVGTGEPVDDWGYVDTERQGFVAGAIAAYALLTDGREVTND